MLLRTDLALEEVATENGSVNDNFMKFNCNISKIILNEEDAKKYKKNTGIYYTIETQAFKMADHDKEQDVIKALQFVIKDLLVDLNISFEDPIFVVGLGNTEITPDALGPMVVNKLIVTKHFYELGNLSEGMRIVSAIAPGVMGQTGIETSNIVNAIIKKEKPKLVVVIDALAARSLKRVNQTIQITTAGISPGSGVGNKRKELSQKTLNVPVIAIGVPTVVDIKDVSNDIFEVIENYEEGMQFENTKNQFFSEIDEHEHLDFIVTPKDIDQNVVDLSEVISRGLNISFHNL